MIENLRKLGDRKGTISASRFRQVLANELQNTTTKKTLSPYFVNIVNIQCFHTELMRFSEFVKTLNIR